jgi:hypothetical protein
LINDKFRIGDRFKVNGKLYVLCQSYPETFGLIDPVWGSPYSNFRIVRGHHVCCSSIPKTAIDDMVRGEWEYVGPPPPDICP